MNIAIVHYQLNRGGVTQVIFNHLHALDRILSGEQWQVAVFFGGRHDAWLGDLESLENLDVSFHVIPQLDFDDYHQAPPIDAETLSHAIRQELRDRGFDPRETVIHAHNHSLGKNLALPGALIDLAQTGFSLLLQIHDFAEDYRAANFRYLLSAAHQARSVAHLNGRSESDVPSEVDAALCYPQASQIHYAVINSRDAAVLKTAGVTDSRLHMIANPVANGPCNWRRGTRCTHCGTPGRRTR